MLGNHPTQGTEECERPGSLDKAAGIEGEPVVPLDLRKHGGGAVAPPAYRRKRP